MPILIWIFIAFLMAPGLSRAIPTAPTIAQLAPLVSVGGWGEVTGTVDIATVLGNSGGNTGSNTAYADNALWHETLKRIYFIGSDKAVQQRMRQYDDTTSTWFTYPAASWMPVVGPHGWAHSAIDESRGLIYHRKYQSFMYRYSIATDTWTQLPSPSSSPSNSCCDAVAYFPEMDGVIWARSGGQVHLYRESTGAWTNLTSATFASGSTWMSAKYNPVHQTVVFMNPIRKAMYKITSDGTVTKLRDLYANAYDGNSTNGTFAVDPVSGQMVLISATSRDLYSHDLPTDTWATVTSVDKPDMSLWQIASVGAPSAGGILVFGCRNLSTCKLWLYKHDASAPRDTTAPTVALTNPTSGCPLSGSIPLTAVAFDGVGVEGVQMYVDGFEYGNELTTPPYTTNWDTTWLSNGTHVITARARDFAGNITVTAPLNVTVSNIPEAALPAADYATRCAANGVIRCYGFDDLTDITTGHPRLLTNPVDSTVSRLYPPANGTSLCTGGQCWQLDTAIKSTGASSLRFEIPNGSSSDTSGTFRLNFADDFSNQVGQGEELYFQVRQRFAPDMLHKFLSTSGFTAWKQFMIGRGDRVGSPIAYSCTTEEMVLVQSTYYMGPTFYHSCGNWYNLNWTVPGGIRLQHVDSPYCLYPNDPSGGCYKYAADEWMTFKVNIRIAGWGRYKHNRIRIWAAREGQASTLLYDTNLSHQDGPTILHNDAGAKYGKIWLLPYMTGKSTAEVHPTTYTWYDDLIISRKNIADPQ